MNSITRKFATTALLLVCSSAVWAQSATVPTSLQGTYNLTVGTNRGGTVFNTGDQKTFVVAPNNVLCVDGLTLGSPVIFNNTTTDAVWIYQGRQYALKNISSSTFQSITILSDPRGSYYGAFEGTRSSTDTSGCNPANAVNASGGGSTVSQFLTTYLAGKTTASVPAIMSGTYTATLGSFNSSIYQGLSSPLTLIVGTDGSMCLNGKTLMPPYLSTVTGSPTTQPAWIDPTTRYEFLLYSVTTGTVKSGNVYQHNSTYSNRSTVTTMSLARTADATVCADKVGTVTPTLSTAATDVFSLAAEIFPELFTGGGALQSLDGYVYRVFAPSGVYLAVKEEQLYLMGGPFGTSLTALGSVADIRTALQGVKAGRVAEAGRLRPYGGISPDPTLALAHNNIGFHNVTTNLIHSCVQLRQDGVVVPYEGFSSLGIQYQGTGTNTIGIVSYGEFNPNRLKTESGADPSCSGILDLGTQRLTDTMQYDGVVYARTYSLIPGTITFQLLESRAITRN